MKSTPLALALCLAFSLTGCPADNGKPSARPAATSMQLKVDPSTEGLKVGKTVQLRLGMSGASAEYMLGASLIESKEGNLAKWHAEPAGIVRFEEATAKATFLKTGSVKIWATYLQGEKTLKSNVLELKVAGDELPAKK